MNAFFGSAIAGGIFALIWWVSAAIDRRNGPARAAQNLQRASTIAERVESGQPFSVQSWTPGPLALCLTLVAAFGFWQAWAHAVVDWSAFGLGMALLAWAAVLWQRFARNLQGAFSTLSRTGITSTAYGFLPWTAIDGIHLAHYSSRGMEWRTLELHVPTLEQLTAGMSPANRFFYRLRFGPSRQIVYVDVTLTRESAVVIASVARALWTARTGLHNDWQPFGSTFKRGPGDQSRARLTT